MRDKSDRSETSLIDRLTTLHIELSMQLARQRGKVEGIEEAIAMIDHPGSYDYDDVIPLLLAVEPLIETYRYVETCNPEVIAIPVAMMKTLSQIYHGYKRLKR